MNNLIIENKNDIRIRLDIFLSFYESLELDNIINGFEYFMIKLIPNISIY